MPGHLHGFIFVSVTCWWLATGDGVDRSMIRIAGEGRAVHHGVQELQAALDISRHRLWDGGTRVIINISTDVSLGPEDFVISKTKSHILIRGGGDVGAMYGALDLAQDLRKHPSLSWQQFLGALPTDKAQNARFQYRALKLNLPWSPYRNYTETKLQFQMCQNVSFWSSLLDMMAVNRFNVLSLWSEHPFPYMIRPQNFPNATPFKDAELAQWKELHKTIFRLARDRGIAPYIVDWNIFVSEAYKENYDPTAHADTDGTSGSATVNAKSQKYNRECITQMIDEYSDLAGIGISVGDRVDNMKLKGQLQWVQDVVVGGMKAASRPVKLIYRAPFGEGTDRSMDPGLARKFIETSGLARKQIWVQIKFNWSHGHSTTTLVHVHGVGKAEAFYSPPPDFYDVTWMVRNEDFFHLRWGSANFIRSHIKVNGQSWVGGYAIGSEGFIPAQEYGELPSEQTWTYAFERQWLFYALWGRLLYDPSTSDTVFQDMFTARYGSAASSWTANLLNGFELAGRMPLRLASFLWNTWDFTLKSSHFAQPVGNHDHKSGGFISVETMLRSSTLDPALQNITDFIANGPNASQTSPEVLANMLADDGSAALAGWDGAPTAIRAEVRDIQTWAHLSLYFSFKLRGSVALGHFRVGHGAVWQAWAVGNLTQAAEEWEQVILLTGEHLRPKIFMMDMQKWNSDATMSWAGFRSMVQRDIRIANASSQAEAPKLLAFV